MDDIKASAVPSLPVERVAPSILLTESAYDSGDFIDSFPGERHELGGIWLFGGCALSVDQVSWLKSRYQYREKESRDKLKG